MTIAKFLSLFAVLSFGGGGCGNVDDLANVEATRSPILGGGITYDWSTQCTVGGVAMHCCPPGTAMNGLYNSGGGVFKCLPFASAGPRELDVATTMFVKTPNLSSGTTMHVCGEGKVMVGFHASKNYLACQPYQPKASVGNHSTLYNTYRDDGTQDTDGRFNTPRPPVMHVCASFADPMRGLHAGNNQFACIEELERITTP